MSETNKKQTEDVDASGDASCSVVAMCQAWQEMNTIRDRDGVPYDSYGYKASSQEWWDKVMDNLDLAVTQLTGQGCWLHPALYDGDKYVLPIINKLK